VTRELLSSFRGEARLRPKGGEGSRRGKREEGDYVLTGPSPWEKEKEKAFEVRGVSMSFPPGGGTWSIGETISTVVGRRVGGLQARRRWESRGTRWGGERDRFLEWGCVFLWIKGGGEESLRGMKTLLGRNENEEKDFVLPYTESGRRGENDF